MPTDTAPTTDLAPVDIQRPKTLLEAKTRGASVPMVRHGASFLPAFSDGGQMMEFAAMMAGAGVMVGPAARGNPGACMGIVMMAGRFGVDPFMLSTKAYITKNKAGVEVLAWEAQAIYAMLLGSGELEAPLEFEYDGDGPTRRVTVIGRLRGAPSSRSITTNTVGKIEVKNSPLWKSEPDQQLAYYGSRLWARRHAPHVLMGVYDREEAAEADAIPGSFVEVPPDKSDPSKRLVQNLAEGRKASAPKLDPDPPATAQPAPADEPDADEDEALPIAAETEGEAGEEPAAETEPSVRELPPHPGELIRTKKGGLEYAERWAAHYRALPRDQEDAFIDETEESARLANALNPKAEDVLSDAINSPKTLV